MMADADSIFHDAMAFGRRDGVMAAMALATLISPYVLPSAECLASHFAARPGRQYSAFFR